MANPIILEIEIASPVELILGVEPSTYIGTALTGPQGPPGTSIIPDASETEKGIIQLASQGEVTTGTNGKKAVVPGTLKPELDKKAQDDIASLTLIFNNQLI